ncbi:MAG: putative transporter [Planctomycetes bacterium]|nr:putative transporter [Planctomycetota bacterium]
MNWFLELLRGESAAHSVLALAIVIASGLALGHLRVRGIGLGVAGVLFTGLLAAHWGLHVHEGTLEFVREFGLILFVYTIGMQVGPSFMASFRKEGLRLNLLAGAVVLGGVAMAAAIWYFAKLPVAVAVGLLSGGVTNTPGLGAAQQALKEVVPGAAEAGQYAGMAYAAAYPFGILGVIGTMLLLRGLFGIRLADETAAYEKAQAAGEPPQNFNFQVANPSLVGRTLTDLAGLVRAEFVVSRLMRGDSVTVPEGAEQLQAGDLLHVVCTRSDAEKLAIVLGSHSAVDVRKQSGEIVARNVTITRRSAAGHTIRELDILARHGAAITRVQRAGIELVAHASMVLHFGDRVMVVGDADAVRSVAAELGDSMKVLLEPDVLPMFFGVILGVILGSLPIGLPGVAAPLKIGLAGGPLLVALVLSSVRKVGPLVFYLPQSANLALREVGIALFLACVGLKAGERFVPTLTSGDGLVWMGLAALITVLPLFAVGLFARLALKMNYLPLCGLLAGSMTDPPALSFANQTTGSDAPSVTYASVYALTMFLRILTAQLFVLLLA